MYKSVIHEVLLIEETLVRAPARRAGLLLLLLLRGALANLSSAGKTTVSTSHRFKKLLETQFKFKLKSY